MTEQTRDLVTCRLCGKNFANLEDLNKHWSSWHE